MRRGRALARIGLLSVAAGLAGGAAPAAANELSGRDRAGTRFFVDGSKARVTLAKPLARRTALRLTCVELVGTGMSAAYAELVTRRVVVRAGQRRWTVRFSRDASRLIDRCGLARGGGAVDLTDSDIGAVMRRLTGPPPGCRAGRREMLVASTGAVRVTHVEGLLLRICRPGDARPADVDGFYQDLSHLHLWIAPTAVANTVAWVDVDVAQGNDSLSVRGDVAGVGAVHRIDYRRLGSSDQRTYDVRQLICAAAGAFALLVRDNIAGRDVLYAGRLATDTGATIDTSASGAITALSLDDERVAWSAGGRQRTAMLP